MKIFETFDNLSPSQQVIPCFGCDVISHPSFPKKTKINTLGGKLKKKYIILMVSLIILCIYYYYYDVNFVKESLCFIIFQINYIFVL